MILLQVNDALTQGQVYAIQIKEMLLHYAPKVLGAILVYVAGSWVIRSFSHVLRRLLIAKKFDSSLQSFLISLFHGLMMILLFISISEMAGISITGFAAILAGAGVAIGAALNGSLGNLAGGVMLMIFKPFKLNDRIEALNSTGTVIELGIFNTVILTSDKKTVILPNGALSTGVIVNYTTHGNLRVDLEIPVDISENIDKARELAINAMLTHPNILKDPSPEVRVQKVTDSAVNLALYPYTVQANYWDVYYGAQELVVKAWAANGIKSPVQEFVIRNKN